MFEELESECMPAQQVGTGRRGDGTWGGFLFGHRLRKSLNTSLVERELPIITILKGKSDQDCHSQNPSMIYYCFEDKTQTLQYSFLDPSSLFPPQPISHFSTAHLMAHFNILNNSRS